MINWFRVLALAGALLFAVAPAVAQQFAPGYLQANTAATTGAPRASSPSSWLDRWCSSSNNAVPARLSGSWACLASANNAIWATNGSGVPALTQTIPSAVQDNITRLGTIASGVWQGTAIAATYGGFGANISAQSGVPIFASGAATFTATTGSGSVVRATGPTLTLTNATGLPIDGGTTGLLPTTRLSAIYGAFYLSANQSYTSSGSTPAKVNLDTAEQNAGLTFDGVTNRRVTIITAGRYLVAYHGYFIQGTAGDLITVRVKKNGATDISISLAPAAAGATVQGTAGGAKVVSLAAADYLELFVSSPSNGLIGGSPNLTYLSLSYLGP